MRGVVELELQVVTMRPLFTEAHSGGAPQLIHLLGWDPGYMNGYASECILLTKSLRSASALRVKLRQRRYRKLSYTIPPVCFEATDGSQEVL